MNYKSVSIVVIVLLILTVSYFELSQLMAGYFANDFSFPYEPTAIKVGLDILVIVMALSFAFIFLKDKKEKKLALSMTLLLFFIFNLLKLFPVMAHILIERLFFSEIPSSYGIDLDGNHTTLYISIQLLVSLVGIFFTARSIKMTGKGHE